MRPSRWSQKPDAEPVASGSRWNLQWNQENSNERSQTEDRENANSSHPLDYSNENMNRHGKKTDNDTNKCEKNDSRAKKESGSSKIQSDSVPGSHWSYMSQIQQMYPASNHNAEILYPNHHWNTINPDYYGDGQFHRQSRPVYNNKWWEDHQDDSQNALDRFDRSHWYNNSSSSKHEGNFEYGKKFSRFQHSGNFDRTRLQVNKGYSQTNPYNINFNRYKINYRNDKRSSVPSFEMQNRYWKPGKRNYPNAFGASNFVQSFASTRDIKNKVSPFERLGNKLAKPSLKISVKNKKGIKKLKKAKDSDTEIARKKALAAAASKLKETFLAGKIRKKKQKPSKQSKPHSNSETSEKNLEKRSKKTLNVPRSVPKDGTSLEHDIDIKFSSSEWESVGRGEGTSQVVLGASTTLSESATEIVDSDSDSIQTIDDDDDDSIKELSDNDDSIKELSDNDDSIKELSDNDEIINYDSTNEDEYSENILYSSCQSSSTRTRKRHASESFMNELRIDDPHHGQRRTRSYSESHLNEDKLFIKPHTSPLTTNLKKMLLKQLLTLDKTSLQELVNDPKSRKVQFIMNHLMNTHKNMLTHKLNQLRMNVPPSSATNKDDMTPHLDSSAMESLPADVLEQVKEILDFEASGEAQLVWEEVTLSLSDLLSESRVQLSEESRNFHEDIPQVENVVPQSVNEFEDHDIMVLTPPPKYPTATITIPDSDTELPIENYPQSHSSLNQFSHPHTDDKSSDPIHKDTPTSTNSHESPSDENLFLKPQDLTKTKPALPQQERPSDLLSRLSVLLPSPSNDSLNPVSLDVPPHPDPSSNCHLSPSITSPHPNEDEVKRNEGIVKKPSTDPEQLAGGRESSELNLHSPVNVKVKQERPSPMMECGLCMHRSRSPHTLHCGFAFGIPSTPVPLMPGSPKPLGMMPPQRPLPHLASSAMASAFKLERHAGSFLNLEHVNRPSSQERPKNPAPPDNASSEPPSPLPIPPPQSTLHQPPPPPPLLFSSDDHFIEPPRPPSPPPPQHSPRIKIERQTPQYICCCMRNECERSSSSRQSADITRRSSVTPQGQSCETSNLRTTPHSMFKYDPSYLSNLRSRTPHNGYMNMFSSISLSSRFLPSSNGHVIPGLNPNHSLNILPTNESEHCSRMDRSSQTERLPSQFLSNVDGASTSSVSAKIDQTTSTHDLSNQPFVAVNQASFSKQKEAEQQSEEFNPCIVSTSSLSDDRVSSILNKFRGLTPTGSAINQLMQLSSCEKEILSCMDLIEKKEKELAKERRKLKEVLDQLQEMSFVRIQAQIPDEERRPTSSQNIKPCTQSDIFAFTNPPQMDKNTCDEKIVEMVSSSQEEISHTIKALDSPFECSSNDSQSHVDQGERCTSTFRVETNEEVTCKQESNSNSFDEKDNGNISNSSELQDFWLTKKHLAKRRRLSLSTSSNELQEGDNKIKKEDKTHMLSAQCENEARTGEESTSSIDLKTEEINEHFEYDKSGNSEIFSGNDVLTPVRKHSLFGSPPSPKMRTSSGSEHGYSLRSRGPPSDLFDFSNDSHSKDALLTSNQEERIELSDDKNDEQQEENTVKHEDFTPIEADSGLEENIESKESSEINALKSPSGDNKKTKRKCKSKFNISKTKKRKELPDISKSSCSKSNESLPGELNLSKEQFKLPPPHLDAVLDLKVVGNLIFSASYDGTARLFDPISGVVLSTYQNHMDSVSCIQIVGKPDFTSGSPTFQVVTGSEDRWIHVYDGKTGVLTQKRNCTEPVRCLSYRWDYLFIGTDGGSGIKWNLKDKKIGEKVRFCGKGITHLLTHMEGGRKVLVVGAKTTPIMVRDAMSGLYLRTLEYAQLTVYSALFEGNLLYTGGADKNIFVYDYCAGTVKEHFPMEASVSSLMLMKNHLIAVCYDGVVRLYKLPKGELTHAIPVNSSHKMYICSAMFRNKVLLGNKKGEIVLCELPDLTK